MTTIRTEEEQLQIPFTADPIRQPQVITVENGHYRITSSLTLKDLCDLTAQLLKQEFRRIETMTSSDKTKSFLQCKLSHREQEIFCVLYLDNQHGLIEYEELFTGTIDCAAVYPRELLKRCLHFNAAAIILAHNHPSGIPEPSSSDTTVTKRIIEALKLIDVRLLDHIVVAGNGTTSFAERGLL